MQRFLKRIFHFITSNSRHGTHSPFVYQLADEVIYNKTIEKSDSLIMDIQKYYFAVGVGGEQFLITTLEEQPVEALAKLQEDYFMIFLTDIYQNSLQEQRWKAMQMDSRFIVLVDLFEFGVVCNRKAQPKETFKLRFPYWKY